MLTTVNNEAKWIPRRFGGVLGCDLVCARPQVLNSAVALHYAYMVHYVYSRSFMYCKIYRYTWSGKIYQSVVYVDR